MGISRDNLPSMTTALATILVLLVVLGLGAIASLTVLSLLRANWVERKARSDQDHAEKIGAQPVSLHPKVDTGRCIGSGACVTVCPEKDVLAVLDGKAHVVNPTSCIGHGECLRACPVDAIELVLGSEKRGVEIPLVNATFESNVAGLYVVGELGGMGLVYNATTQAIQAIRAIGKAAPPRKEGVLQVLIVGLGPAGLAASLAAMEQGLHFATLEQEDLGGTVLHYPRHKIIMTKPVTLPLYGPLRVSEVSKEALLATWQDIVKRTGLEPMLMTGVRVDKVARGEDGIFDITTSKGAVRAQRVVLAMGRRGTPRKLGIPGEELGKVTYRLLEPERYVGAHCVVVGGGDAAVEAAVALGEAKAHVTLAYRGTVFDRIKKKNQQYLDKAVEAGKVLLLLKSSPVEIKESEVIFDVGGAKQSLRNDYVLIFAGGVLPTAFLEAAGVEVHTFKGERYAPAN
jgi:thioredoxin reductase (NADPH)